MNRVLPDLSDDQILVKVAQRAACLHRAAKIKVDDINKQFNEFVDEYLKRPEVDALFADRATASLAGEIRERIAGMVQDKFIPTPSEGAATEIQELETLAYDILPANIASVKWSPDTCQCKLHIVGGEQTFLATPCEFHDTLDVEKNHDAVHAENRLKNTFHGAIIADDPAASELEYKWSFDADRNLVVDVSGLDPSSVAKIEALKQLPEFKEKVIVEGAIIAEVIVGG